MDKECIEDNIPTEEEQSRLRQERLTEIGKLPMDYGIFTVILTPDKSIMIQSDGLALFEIVGLLEFARVRTKRAIAHADEQDGQQNGELLSQTIM
jgi:hypothetical protein